MPLFGSNYFKPQYFNAAYLHGATAVPAQDGRSGYWRLFYYEMQEEALREKRDDQVPANAAAQDTLVKREDIPVAAKPVRKKRKPAPAEPAIPKVKERPLLRRIEQQEQPDITPLLRVISNDFRAMVLSLEPLRVKMLEQKAANDEEGELIHLLLLAA